MQLGSYSKTGIRKIIRVGVRKVWSESPRIDYCISNHDDVYCAAACIRPTTRLLMQAGWPAINFLARIETFSQSYFVWKSKRRKKLLLNKINFASQSLKNKQMVEEKQMITKHFKVIHNKQYVRVILPISIKLLCYARVLFLFRTYVA